MSLEQQQNAVPFIETEHWREAYHALKKETPDFGEPWHDPFSSPSATAQINILNRHNELVRGRVCDQRKIECVNACAGMTDPAAEIAEIRAYAQRCKDGCIALSHSIDRIDYACGEPNDMQVSDYCVHQNDEAVVERVKSKLAEIAAMREAIRGFAQASERLILGSHGVAFLPGQMSNYNKALAKLKPFLP